MSEVAAPSPQESAAPAPAPAQSPDASFDTSLASRLAEISGATSADDVLATADRDTQGRDTAHPDAAKSSGEDAPAEKAEDEPIYKIKLKVDGKEEERDFKRSELAERLQKSEAAQKRFEEAATLRKQADAIAASAAQERAQLAQALQHYTQQLQASAPRPPDADMLASDPVAYLQQRHQYEQWMQQAQQVQAAQAHLAQQEQAAAHEQYRAHIEAQGAELLKAIPEWSDPAKAKAGKESVRAALKQYGFGDDEIGSVADARFVRLAHEASQAASLRAEIAALKADQQRAQADLTARLKGLPPVRTERPGSAETSSTDGRTRAMQSLRRSGTVEDAAAVLRGLL